MHAHVPHRSRLLTATLAAVLVSCGLSALPARAAITVPAAAPVTTVASGPVPAGDEAVTASADAAGYHLFAAAAADRWTWHPLATLQPGGDRSAQWTGEQCLTADGRYIVAVVAPWSASNSESGVDSGGVAYAVDAHTGVVRPLMSGVAPVYFNPGCGTGHQVALTAYAGPAQRPTRITVVDAATGVVTRTGLDQGELTSAVADGDRLLAASGNRLVQVGVGHTTVLATVAGQVAELRPSADGGVDLLGQGTARTGVWHWTPTATRHLADGDVTSTHLLPGADGHNFVTGVRAVPRGSTVTALSSPAGDPTSASSHGGLIVLARHTAGIDGSSTVGRHVLEAGAGDVQARGVDLGTTSGRVSTALPPRSASSAGSFAAAANASATACAVPRGDIFAQAMQPASNQVRWAVLQAVQGGLSAARPAGNAMYATGPAHYSPLATAAPSSDFPLGGNGPTVPPLVVFGILAQESNWDQATWHALPGRSGNPLTANYYGIDPAAGAPTIDYSKADCGYGIGQVTDGMTADGSGHPTDRQVRIAVDYATNVAASVAIIKSKWTQLQNLGITMNDNDPTKVENWYAAIWGYNSGVYTAPNSANGIGWLNNPANPIYPHRTSFLHNGLTATPDDARTPNHWPYQERVFGWIEVPQLDSAGYLRYRGTYDWDTGLGGFLTTPGPAEFCSQTINNCVPTAVGSGADPCPAESSLCWWNAPVRWADCSTQCTTDTPTQAPNNHTYYSAPGTAEPAAVLNGYPAPAIPCTPASPGAGAVIVDDEDLPSADNAAALTPNLMGCSSPDTAIRAPASANAQFTLLDGQGNDVLATPSSLAAIDLHQLGAGTGGHMYFTHVGTSADAAYEVRGQWSATLAADSRLGSAYEIKAYVPDIGAGAAHATYEIDPGVSAGRSGSAALRRTVDQSVLSNQWVSLGYYVCGGTSAGVAGGPASCTMTVTVRTNTPDSDTTHGADLAMDAVAFVPAPLHSYVALGDSYSSGEGLSGGWDPGTDVAQNEADDNGNLCHRSAQSWPRLLATAKNVPIVELACSGSNAADITGTSYWLDQTSTPFTVLGLPIPGFYNTTFLNDGSLEPQPTSASQSDNWITDFPNQENAGTGYFGEPAYQLDLLRALQPRVVTLTIGGNDLGFADILNSCTHSPPDCQQVFGRSSTGPDKIDNRIQSLSGAGVLQDVYRKVAAAAGSANRVYVVTYPAPMAGDPAAAPDASMCTGLLNSASSWLASKVTELAAVIKNAGAQTGVHVIDASTTFAGHEACSGSSYVTEPDWVHAPVDTESQLDNWMHPNQQGYQALEQTVAAHITIPAS